MHFSVGVICDDLAKLKIILEPYKESCNEEYMVFVPATKEEMDKYETMDKDAYETFDDFMRVYYGYTQHNGVWGELTNPEAKWDWCVLGGRYLGALLVKEDTYYIEGEPGTFGNSSPIAPKGYKWVDACRVADVQWDKMKQLSMFDIQRQEAKDGDIWSIITNENHDLNRTYTYYKSSYYWQRFINKENYIKHLTCFFTYNVVTPDGVWHEPAADRGWFDIDENNQFVEIFFDRFIKPNMDKFIAVIDCHM